MRLWHYKLIPYLPNSQLIAQWRELNSIYKNQPKHILINYVYEYPKTDLMIYSNLVIAELTNRNIKKNLTNYYNYFDCVEIEKPRLPFKNHHTNRYLNQCFYNLQEKYDRGQKDFNIEQYRNMKGFVRKVLELTWEKLN